MDQNLRTATMLKGWFVHYNFLRPHSALNGKTPAKVAGINLDVSNRWESRIDQAIKWKNKTGGLVQASVKTRSMVGLSFN